MFLHVFKYRLKVLIRDRSMIFWTLMFPLVLAFLFKMAFSGIGKNESFEPISLAVVDSPAYQQDIAFQSALESVSTGENPLFKVELKTLEEAKDLLKAGSIRGYVLEDETVQTNIASAAQAAMPIHETQWSLVVRNSGLGQSIIKVFLDQYSQSQRAVGMLMAQGPVDVQRIMEVASERETFTKEVTMTAAKMDMTLNYFYGLMAMACMYGAFFGTLEVNLIQANISQRAARVNLVPLHKLKLFLYGSVAAMTVQFIQMLTLLSFIIFVLGIDFGDRVGWIIVTLFLGSFVGIFFGAFVSALVVSNESLKLAITLTVSMVGSLLAGMMVADVKYLVSVHAPILQYINPVHVISDAFYSLYYFTSMERYFMNLALLSGFAVIFALGTYVVVRGRKYASL
jgi:ABC-2 type transport system permease protein